MRVFKNLYLTYRFFITFLAILFLFVLSFTFKALFFVSQVALIILVAFTLLDTFILFQIKKPLKAKRKHAKVLSLGDDNTIQITLISRINFTAKLKIIDELPEQLQERHFRIKTTISPSSPVQKLKYSVNPK